GGRIHPVSVPLASWRGVWLSLRYVIRTGEVVVVAGGRPVRARARYEAVRADVAAAVGAARTGRPAPHRNAPREPPWAAKRAATEVRRQIRDQRAVYPA